MIIEVLAGIYLALECSNAQTVKMKSHFQLILFSFFLLLIKAITL